MDWRTHKKQLLKRSDFRKAYEESGPEYEIAKAIIKARVGRGITQKQLAERLNTKQSVISRVENARTTPSLSFLRRLSEALEVKMTISFWER